MIASERSASNLKQYALQFLNSYKLYMSTLLVIAIFAGFFEVAVDYKIKEIIDTIADAKDAYVGYLILFFILYKLMHHGAYFLSRVLNIKYKPMILEESVTHIYKKTVQHSLNWFDSHLAGEISSKIADFEYSVSTLITYLFNSFSIVTTMLITIYYLSRINLHATIVLLIFIIIYTPVMYLLLKKQIQLQEAYIHAKQSALGKINDYISNIFSIKIIGDISAEFKTNLRPAIRNWKLWNKKTREFDTYYIDNVDTLMIIIMSAIQIYLLTYLYQNDIISAGSFAFVAMMTLKIHIQLSNFLENILFNIMPSIAQMRSSYSFVGAAIDVIDKENSLELRDVEGIIEYKDVSFCYDTNATPVLNSINITITPNEKIGVVGSSGAGKSTMIKCLLRYFDIQEGAIFIDNKDIRHVSQRSLRRAISIIPQDISMLHSTIRANLKLAKHDATDAEIILACKKARIHDDIVEMTKGYDTLIGERGAKLSGGQKQRIAIARAILKNAPILILDEATSSLDTETERLIQDSINEFLKSNKSTVIAIAHRLSTLKYMDRIIVLDQGRIVEMGTHNQLIQSKDGLYKKLWKTQIT